MTEVMIHKTKVLGLVLLAISALGAVAASPALAVEGTITSESPPATITASQTTAKTVLSFREVARHIECSVVTYDSVSPLFAPASSIELKPLFSGCVNSPGGGSATVSLGACRYSLTMSEKVSATEGHGSLTIKGCGTGSNASTGALYIVAKKAAGGVLCEYEIGNQGPLSTITWKSTAAAGGKKADVDLTLALSGTAKVVEGVAAFCGKHGGESVSVEDAGGWTMTADTGGAPVGLFIS
jgi:hypothetical protein